MKPAVLFLVLVTGCASLSDTTHDVEHAANVVDEGAQKLQAVISQIRTKVKGYASVAVDLCSSLPVDADACQELDSLASQLVQELDNAQAALDLYNARKGDFVDAYEAVMQAVQTAGNYAGAVVQLHDRSKS